MRDFPPGFVARALGFLLLTSASHAFAASESRPNILWILADDLGLELGCYGHPLVRTPHTDRLAASGMRFTQAFTTAPVCSSSRSALFTGRYQTTIGAHHHRTANPQPLPAGVRTIAEQFRARGYYTVNVSPAAGDPGAAASRNGAGGSGKTDFNFTIERAFDGSSWTQRAPGQPFFAQLTFAAPHRGPVWAEAKRRPQRIDPAAVTLPAYCPDHPIARQDIANYLEAVQLGDAYLGELLARLEREGLAENTIVIFTSDNGQCLFRSKQFLYDGGLRVPLIIRWPERRRAGTVDDRLVSGIDLAPTVLGLAGIAPDAGMHGRDFLRPGGAPRDHIVAARDRMGLAVDRQRAIRTRQHKYIRNYLPAVPFMQTNLYKEREYPTWNLLKELKLAGRLTAEQALFAAETKPVEELYDVLADPDEVRNLAVDPAHAAILKTMRTKLDEWLATYDDQGRIMEEPLEVVRVNRAYAEPARSPTRTAPRP